MRSIGLVIWAAVCGCAAEPADVAISKQALSDSSACRTTELAWGHGAGEVGLRPALPEARAWGPPAVAVAPSGEVLVLDALNARVLAVGARGEARVAAAGIAIDAEDLAVGADQALAVFSSLQARTWLFEPDGTPAGSVALDRAFRHMTGLSIGPSRQLAFRSAYQETFRIGSPSAPLDLASSLASKREGAFLLADGRGVAVRAAGGRASLLVVDNPADRRSTVVTAYDLPGAVDAAQLVGLSGTTACVRTERLDAAPTVVVHRRAVCLDVRSGRVTLDRALAVPGIYQPRHELALGGSPPRLAMVHATPDALAVTTCEVAR
jgi:hypothetical protein